MPPSTRKAVDFKLKNLIGPGKEFLPSEVPTLRAVIQKGILIQEKLVIEEEEAGIFFRLTNLVKSLHLKSRPSGNFQMKNLSSL